MFLASYRLVMVGMRSEAILGDDLILSFNAG